MEKQKNTISMEEVGKFLEGRDPQERIVNLLYNYQNNYVTVVYRNENDQKCANDEPFFPFVWATKYACLKLAQVGKDRLTKMMREYGIWVKKLSNTDVDGNVIESFNDGYIFQFYSTRPMSYQKFLEFFRNAGNPVYSKDNTQLSATESRQYLAIPPQEQFLIQTGKRFFKGYDDYDQLLRMIFDVETEGLNPRKDRIKLNGVKLNRPVTINGVTYKDWGRIFDLKGKTKEEKDKSELEIIELMLKLIYTFKPDVITAHNGENFDWNFLIVRCEELGTSMEELSKKYFNGDYIRKEEKPSILKLGGEIEEFYRTIIPNTTVTDSLHAVRRAQATDSNFLKADLKYSSKYLGLKKDNRVYTPGAEIDKILVDTEHQYAFNDKDGDWYVYDPNSENGKDIEFKKGKDGDRPFIKYTRNYLADGYELVTGRYIIERYLLDDLWECDRVEYTLNGTDFMLTKMIPLPFSKCCTMGTAGQWKAIMLAWSYENGLAVPLAANTGAFTGGLSRLVKVGYVDNVVKLDFNSLYPSIILTWAISDENDLMKAMLYMLEYVLTTREKYKGLKKSAGKVVDKFNERNNSGEKLTAEEISEWEQAKNEYKSNDNRQMVVKKLGNSFFGSYGSNNGAVFPWKSTKCAEQTTCTGRQCLRLMISHFHNLGYQPIVGDTDGFNFKLPTNNYKIEPVLTDFVIPSKEGDTNTFDSTDKLCIKLENNTIIHVSIDDIVKNKITENCYVLIENEWVNKNDIEISEEK
jgi:DNA polymerase elongation subunit (family B)